MLFHSAALSYLLRLNSRTIQELGLSALKKKIGFTHPIIGLHVRHGDACHTSERAGNCFGLKVYLPAIRAMSRRYNISKVFVATDDPKTISSAMALDEGLEFITVPVDRSGFQNKDFMEFKMKQGKLDP